MIPESLGLIISMSNTIIYILVYLRMILIITELVKNPPIMQETTVRFLGWEDLLEKGWVTHSSILGLPLWLSW